MTTITISKDTKERLRAMGSKGETFDEIVTRVIIKACEIAHEQTTKQTCEAETE